MPDESPLSTDSPVYVPQILHQLESPNGRVVVQYRWSGDRFVHQVLVNGQVCLSSVDGDGSQAWPASPPIQQISLEPIQNVPMILGVGGAGRGHWSISVGWQADDDLGVGDQGDGDQGDNDHGDGDHGDDDQGGGEFRFDIACRVKGAAEFLGSTYAVKPSAGEALEIAVVVGTKTQADKRIAILAELDDTSKTYRWVYSVRV